MPNLDTHSSQATTKLLLIGDSGSGKTGALASLVNQLDKRLLIIDMDNGLTPLAQYVDKAKRPKVFFETCTDDFKVNSGRAIPLAPKAYARALQLLTHWKTATEDLGSSDTWGTDTVVVLDSLTFFGEAAMRQALFLNGRQMGPRQQADWGLAMDWVETALAILYSAGTKCNVVVTSHITFESDEGGQTRAYPNALGRKLPPKVGRYFDHMLQTRSAPDGSRWLHTKGLGLLELKSPIPSVPDKFPISTGLADYFRLSQGKAPAAA